MATRMLERWLRFDGGNVRHCCCGWEYRFGAAHRVLVRVIFLVCSAVALTCHAMFVFDAGMVANDLLPCCVVMSFLEPRRRYGNIVIFRH